MLNRATYPAQPRPLTAWVSDGAAPAIAAALAGLGILIGWRGGDLASHVHQIELFRRQGFLLWDPGWFGGYWLPSYSTLFAPIGAVLGLGATGLVSAAVAAWAFDRLVVAHYGPSARIGSLAFAVWTLAQLATAQLPFLCAEAIALCALLAATRRRWWLAFPLVVACALTSPLAAAFLCLCVTAVVLANPSYRTARWALLAVLPVVVIGGLMLFFPGPGRMPFTWARLAVFLPIVLVAWAITPSSERTVRVALLLYAAAIVGCKLIPNPVGAIIVRLGQCVGGPLMICVLWPKRKVLLGLVVIGFGLVQWLPAAGAMSAVNKPATTRAYFQPLTDYLVAHDVPRGRVEVVPTQLHWENAYVAPVIPLARGGERQLDTAKNPIFYDSAPLTDGAYHAWLVKNGVRFVALSDATLDYSARQEAHLLRGGVPGLEPVWSDAHWRLYKVAGSPGLAEGVARIVRRGHDTVELKAALPGATLLRIRDNGHWKLRDGQGCVLPGPDDWVTVIASRPGPLNLSIDVTHTEGTDC